MVVLYFIVTNTLYYRNLLCNNITFCATHLAFQQRVSFDPKYVPPELFCDYGSISGPLATHFYPDSDF